MPPSFPSPDHAPQAGVAPHSPSAPTLAGLRTFLLDLDGVVYTGNTPIPGAREFVRFLKETQRRFTCITNNSTLTGQQFAAKLRRMNVDVDEAHVLTSPQATAVYLREHVRLQPGARIFPIGEEGLVRALLDEGYRLVDEDADVVVCGLDRRLTYDRLMRACFAIRAGAQFVATNPDLSLPTETGLLPGNGATIAYLQAATGVTATVIGKPQSTMLDVAMERAGSQPRETAIIGDGLLTDMAAGHRAGVTTILVLTGVTQRAHLATAPVQPHYVFENLPALQEALSR